MEITTDVILKGNLWKNLTSTLKPIFKTYWEVYKLCISIGIMYDKQYEFETPKDESPISIPRTILHRNENILNMMFQAAILSTNLYDYEENDRLNLAFDDENAMEFNKLQFLTKFANFGAIKLEKLIGIDDIETMENIKSFLSSSIEGNNFEVTSIDEKLEKIEIDWNDLKINS